MSGYSEAEFTSGTIALTVGGKRHTLKIEGMEMEARFCVKKLLTADIQSSTFDESYHALFTGKNTGGFTWLQNAEGKPISGDILKTAVISYQEDNPDMQGKNVLGKITWAHIQAKLALAETFRFTQRQVNLNNGKKKGKAKKASGFAF